MSTFTFTNPVTGRPIQVQGPESLTEQQAREIFEQQLNSGSFEGLKPGEFINSATQLVGGLKAAASQVTQAITGIPGSLVGAATGVLTNIQQQATNAVSGSVQRLVDSAKNTASALPVKELLANPQSIATKAVATINESIASVVPTNGINIADLAKQSLALMPIQGLDKIDVRAAVSQASKLTDQAFDLISNDKGLGKFGFDASQLEKLGVLKPGTASLISSGVGNLTSVLNSPSVWTGEGGITSVTSLLGSSDLQDKLQQQLMSQGLSAVKSLGIPIDSLDPSALAGTALNAAKDALGTFKWATDSALPGPLKDLFSNTSAMGAFSTAFALMGSKDAVLQVEPPIPATDTFNRTTINAAVNRILGSAKIPVFNYQSPVSTFSRLTLGSDFSLQAVTLQKDYLSLSARVAQVIKSVPSPTAIDPNALVQLVDKLDKLTTELEEFESRIQAKIRESSAVERTLGQSPDGVALLESSLLGVRQSLSMIEVLKTRNLTRLENLANGVG